VANQRDDFFHKLSNSLSLQYSKIAVEDLKIKNMFKGRKLSKYINDASWNSFVQMLFYKAVARGGEIVKVNPKNTSKACSSCGKLIRLSLKTRVYKCTCGLILDRDINAAINICSRAGLNVIKLTSPIL
jgi:putative transposase